MIEEFDFFRKVRNDYSHIPIQLTFKYCLSHRLEKTATAQGSFSCHVNPHSQTVEYIMQLQSDVIQRPYSERDSFLFSYIFEEIPPQTIHFENYIILKQRYRVPIDYSWQKLVVSGAESAINKNTLQVLFKRWEIKGINDQPVDAKVKVLNVRLIW